MVAERLDNTTAQETTQSIVAARRRLQVVVTIGRLVGMVVTARVIASAPAAARVKMDSTTVPAIVSMCVRPNELLPMVATTIKP